MSAIGQDRIFKSEYPSPQLGATRYPEIKRPSSSESDKGRPSRKGPPQLPRSDRNPFLFLH